MEYHNGAYQHSTFPCCTHELGAIDLLHPILHATRIKLRWWVHTGRIGCVFLYHETRFVFERRVRCLGYARACLLILVASHPCSQKMLTRGVHRVAVGVIQHGEKVSGKTMGSGGVDAHCAAEWEGRQSRHSFWQAKRGSLIALKLRSGEKVPLIGGIGILYGCKCVESSSKLSSERSSQLWYSL